MIKLLTTSNRLLTSTLVLLAACLCGTATVRAQTPTVITSLPYTISAAGSYVLTANLSSTQTSGYLITVAASNVTLDLQDHFISGPVGNTSQNTTAIYAFERNNITIKNGTIANVNYGIYLDSNGNSTTNNLNHELDHLRISRCNSNGVILYYTASCSVTNCKLSFIGFSGGSSANAIDIYGPGVTVQGCTFSRGLSTNSYAINSTLGSFARQNTISNYSVGVSSGTYQDNLTYGCTTPFSGGIDAGGNK